MQEITKAFSFHEPLKKGVGFGFVAYFAYLESRGVKIRLLEKPGRFFPRRRSEGSRGGEGGVHSDSGCSHTRRVLHFRSSSFCRIHQRPRGMHQPPPAPTNSDEPPPYSSLIWCPKPPSMKVSYSIADIAASHFHSRELKSVSLCNDCGQALSTHTISSILMSG